MPSYFTPKQERMYEHVKESTGDKRIAAMTVNKYRSKHGLTKKKKGKADGIEGVETHVAGTGKSLKDIEGPVRAGRNMPRVAGTKQRQHKRLKAHTPGSSAKKLNDARKALTIGGPMSTFASIFKSSKPEKSLRKSAQVDEESSELEESAVAKGGDDDEVETEEEIDADDDGDEDSQVAKGEGDDEEEGGEECFACPHCASDVTVSDVKNAITKGEIHRKGVGNSPKGHQKHGEKKPKRTAVTEMHGGGTSHNGKPKAGTKSPPRGVPGVAHVPNSGNTGSYAKSGQYGFNSPLMTITKSQGPAGDEAIAREIARMNGVPFEEVGLTEEGDGDK